MGHLPSFTVLGIWIAGIVLVVPRLAGMLEAVGRARKTWIEQIRPMFYDEDQQRRAKLRQLFARHIALEIGRLNDQEDWSDQRFADLEAEVEMKTTERSRFFGLKARSGVRRERSLSRALAKTTERLILVEGEPGSGKSTALRHVARALAAKAEKSRSTRSLIPAYVNLKGLHVPPGRAIDAELIREYVFQVLNRAHNRDVDAVLNEEFDRGLREGTWLFMFDSFDEIPSVLAATAVDDMVHAYEDAISDFLSGMNVCRGVIASREFRGPRRLSWPRMRVLPLSDARREQLIRRASLPPAVTRELLGNLTASADELARLLRNPLFIALLCEHVRAVGSFPRTSYAVFESYFADRLARDRQRVFTRYAVTEPDLRRFAEAAAFRMSASSLGLTPERETLLDAVAAEDERDVAAACLDALEFIKIARSEELDGRRRFTFSHRRFQEYFATRVVLAAPELVSPADLLTDARWRETAVVLLQTQPAEAVAPIVTAAEQILRRQWEEIAPQFDEPLFEIDEETGELDLSGSPSEFPWPETTPHLLSILSAGLGGRDDEIPASLRNVAANFVMAAYRFGSLIDRKIAIEIAGIVHHKMLEQIMLDALQRDSPWLADVAYMQAAQLPSLTPPLSKQIRVSLVRKVVRRTIWRERHTVMAHVTRLNDRQGIARTARLLIAIAVLDDWLLGIVVLLALLTVDAKWVALVVVAITFLMFLVRTEREQMARELFGFAMVSALRTIALLLVFSNVAIRPVQIIAAVLILWTPLALLAASEEQFLAPAWWPFLSLWPLFEFVRNIPRMCRWTWRNGRKAGAGFATIGIVLIVASVVVVVIGDENPAPYVRTAFERRMEILAKSVAAIFVIAFLAVFIRNSIVDFRKAASDRRILKELRSRTIVEVEDFVRGLCALHDAGSRISLIDDARKNRRIAATRDNERRLFELALEVEQGQRSVDDRQLFATNPQITDGLYALVLHVREGIE